MKWINVKDTLPEGDSNVEVILSNGNIVEGKYYENRWMYDPKWDYDTNTISEAVYWRPLMLYKTIEIEGVDYEIPTPVWDLFMIISKERDHYKSVFDGSGN